MEKLYWKGRKIKNAVLFKIKAFFHKRRDELESKKDDLLFEKNVVKEVIKAFIKNICIIALILFLEQILVSEKCDGIFPYGLQKWIIKTNALVVEDRSLLTDVLSAIVGVAGVFLGLYCANIMSMYAEKYANAPQSISRLFENDIVSNKCIKAITNYLIFSVVVLFLQIIQIDIGIIMLIVLGVKALKIIVSFAFMSRRTYQFSDMYYVTNAVYKEIYRNLLHLNKEPYDVLAEYPVILSTTFSSRNSLNSDVVYDYLIMDEASQVDIATGALALSCARNVVIVGDTKQLPNVVTDDIKAKAKAIFDSFNVSEGYQYTNSFLQSILDVMPNVTQALLREHYRCHPKIINFCNQKFYRGELIIMTTDKGEEDVLSVVKTVAGNHERNHYSQRQIDVIKNEIIPKYVSNPEETGIIAPYKNQVEALSKEITDIDAATVHKFQGKEKENIIISTVDDEISDFADDPYLINVAVSRAKKKLMLVVTGNEQSRERNITELIDYIQYNNFEVTESKIYSIFDYLYKQYTEERRVYLQKHKKVSEYDSENLMYSLIEDIISANKYSSLDVVCHFPLNMLIKNPELLNEQECQYAMNPATHLDFLIYNRIGKKPVLAIEVDGYEYHKEDTVQASRDLLKNHIMELYEVPLLRFMTNGSGEKEKIIEMLDKLVG